MSNLWVWQEVTALVFEGLVVAGTHFPLLVHSIVMGGGHFLMISDTEQEILKIWPFPVIKPWLIRISVLVWGYESTDREINSK